MSKRAEFTDLGESTVVPNVTMMGEAISDETQTALLYVLLDGIERLLFGNFEFGVGPTGDLDNHVEDAIGLVGEERNVVEGRDYSSVAFSIDAMFWGRVCESTITGCP